MAFPGRLFRFGCGKVCGATPKAPRGRSLRSGMAAVTSLFQTAVKPFRKKREDDAKTTEASKSSNDSTSSSRSGSERSEDITSRSSTPGGSQPSGPNPLLITKLLESKKVKPEELQWIYDSNGAIAKLAQGHISFACPRLFLLFAKKKRKKKKKAHVFL
jgi:hypothetical protein